MGFAGAVFDALASVRFALSVIVLIATVCAVGTLLPQGTEVAAYLEQHPAAARRMELFAKLGLTHVFHAWWFIALLGVLAATVVVCSARRFATLRRTTGFAQRRALGSMLTHLSILLILAGGVIRGIWGECGYVELREGESITRFQVEKGERAFPFALQLAKFEIERYREPQGPDKARGEKRNESPPHDHLIVEWPARGLSITLPASLGVERVLAPTGEPLAETNSFRITVLKHVPDFIVDSKTREVSSRSSAWNNPAILVRVKGPAYENNRWLFAKFPDFTMHSGPAQGAGPDPLRLVYETHTAVEPAVAGPIKGFKSTLKVLERGEVAQTNVVEVNRPLSYRGYAFYQTGYRPEDLSWTSLQVVRDPGVPVVYAGFGLMILGLFVVFYLNPWLANQRRRA